MPSGSLRADADATEELDRFGCVHERRRIRSETLANRESRTLHVASQAA